MENLNKINLSNTAPVFIYFAEQEKMYKIIGF